METKVSELLLKGLKINFSYKELQELLNRISIVKNEYVSLCNKKIRMNFNHLDFFYFELMLF